MQEWNRKPAYGMDYSKDFMEYLIHFSFLAIFFIFTYFPISMM